MSAKQDPNLLSLIDGAYDVVELSKSESPAQKEWKKEWLAKARMVGAQSHDDFQIRKCLFSEFTAEEIAKILKVARFGLVAGVFETATLDYVGIKQVEALKMGLRLAELEGL